MTDARPQRDVLKSAIGRFWFITLPLGLAAAAVTILGVANTSGGSWAGQGTFIVPVVPPATVSTTGSTPAEDPSRPGDLSQSYRFAQSYAVLLVEDGALVTHLAEQTGLTVDEVVTGTQAVPVPGSAVIRVTFAAADEEQVRAYFDALQQVFDGSPAVTPNIPAGTVRPLQAPAVSVQDGLAPLAPVLAVLALLVVGLGGAVMLERLDPRIRSEADIRELAAWPVLPAPTGRHDPRLAVLLDSVRLASGAARSVVVVGVSGTREQDIRGLVDLLSQGEATGAEPTGHPNGPRLEPSTWVMGGTLAGDGRAEQLVQARDVTVLVARQGARLSRLTASVQSLTDLGVTAVVVAFLTTSPAAEPEASSTTGAEQYPRADDHRRPPAGVRPVTSGR